MKNEIKYYASKEAFEKSHPYVSVIFSEYSPATIESAFTSKKNGQKAQDNRKVYGTILTRRQAAKAIAEWNKKYNF